MEALKFGVLAFADYLGRLHCRRQNPSAARKGISVVAYEDNASGTLVFTADGGGSFEHVTLKPEVTIADAEHESAALALHDDAPMVCYIASSCSTPIHHLPTIRIASS